MSRVEKMVQLCYNWQAQVPVKSPSPKTLIVKSWQGKLYREGKGNLDSGLSLKSHSQSLEEVQIPGLVPVDYESGYSVSCIKISGLETDLCLSLNIPPLPPVNTPPGSTWLFSNEKNDFQILFKFATWPAPPTITDTNSISCLCLQLHSWCWPLMKT